MVEVAPSPKLHNHFETPPVLSSENKMGVWAQVFLGLALNAATGLPFTTIPLGMVAVAEHPLAVVIIRLTVYIPSEE